MTAAVFGITSFDEDAFAECVAFITTLPDNTLEYAFTDGHAVRTTWKDRSRSESWTEEMR